MKNLLVPLKYTRVGPGSELTRLLLGIGRLFGVNVTCTSSFGVYDLSTTSLGKCMLY